MNRSDVLNPVVHSVPPIRAPRKPSPMNEISDASLITQIAHTHDQAAFTELFKRYQPAAFNVACHVAGNRTLAEEAVQEGMLKVWASANTFDPKGNARAWLLTIVAHEAHQLLRRTGRDRARARRKSKEESGRLAECAEGGEDRAELLQALRHKMNALPDKSRKLLALYFGAGMSQRQIGEMLSLPQRTVSHSLQRILDGLRDHLERAGMMSVVPLLNPAGLQEALSSGLEPSKDLLPQILTRPSDATFQDPASVTKEPSSFSTVKATAVLALLLSPILWWAGTYAQKVGAPAKKLNPKTSPLHPPTGPESLVSSDSVSKTLSPVVFPTQWSFTKAPPMNFDVVEGVVRWGIRTRTGLGVLADGAKETFSGPRKEYATLLLPGLFPQRPFKFSFVYRPQSTGKCGANMFWCDGQSVPALEHEFLKNPGGYTNIEVGKEAARLSFYFLGRYVIHAWEKAGKKGYAALTRYEQPYPGERVCLSLSNVMIHALEVQEVTLKNLPPELQAPEKIVRRLNMETTHNKKRIFRSPKPILTLQATR